MPYTNHFDDPTGCLLIRFDGTLTLGVLAQHYAELAEFTRLHAVRFAIADLTAITGVDLGAPSTVTDVSYNEPHFTGEGSRVFVAHDPQIRLLAEQFISHNQTNQPFYLAASLDEAFRKLRIRPANFRVIGSIP